MKVNKVKLPAVVGIQSLIGTSRERPVSWGNYFSLNSLHNPRVVNMWAENLEHLVNTRILDDILIEGWLYENKKVQWFLVDDVRVPIDYLYNKLCFTGSFLPSFEIAEHMFNIVGDPEYELERWIDEISYWKKRGSSFNPKTGIITTKINSTSRKLKATFIYEEE